MWPCYLPLWGVAWLHSSGSHWPEGTGQTLSGNLPGPPDSWADPGSPTCHDATPWSLETKQTQPGSQHIVLCGGPGEDPGTCHSPCLMDRESLPPGVLLLPDICPSNIQGSAPSAWVTLRGHSPCRHSAQRAWDALVARGRFFHLHPLFKCFQNLETIKAAQWGPILLNQSSRAVVFVGLMLPWAGCFVNALSCVRP